VLKAVPLSCGSLAQLSERVDPRRVIGRLANVDAAEKWFAENDPEGVAFEYEVLE
jgi:hypothetical protein